MALCLQINLGEMTLATGKRKIAKAVLPDRKDKQGAQLPLKPPPEAERSRLRRAGTAEPAGVPSPGVWGVRDSPALTGPETPAGLLPEGE